MLISAKDRHRVFNYTVLFQFSFFFVNRLLRIPLLREVFFNSRTHLVIKRRCNSDEYLHASARRSVQMQIWSRESIQGTHNVLVRERRVIWCDAIYERLSLESVRALPFQSVDPPNAQFEPIVCGGLRLE